MENFLPKVWSCPVPGPPEWVKLFFSPPTPSSSPYFRAKRENLRFRRELPRGEHNSSRRIFQSRKREKKEKEKKRKEKKRKKSIAYQLVSEVAFFQYRQVNYCHPSYCLEESLPRSREYLIFSTLISLSSLFQRCIYLVNILIALTSAIRK